MINVENISKFFGPQTLYENANFSIEHGKKIALLGPNGAGKTTFFKILLGEEQVDSGDIRCPKNYRMGILRQEWQAPTDLSILQACLSEHKQWYSSKMKLSQLQSKGQMTEQEQQEYTSLEEEFFALGSYTVEQEAKELLVGLGFLDEQLNTPCKDLSGGWQMRIHLAGLLLQKPDVLLLDEPTNHLDIPSVQWLEIFLKRYPHTVMMITHDRRLAEKICTQVLEFAPPKLNKWPYRVSRFEIEKVERQKILESEYNNKMKELSSMEDFINRFKAKASKARQAQSRMKSAENYKKEIELIKSKMPNFSKRTSQFKLELNKRLPKVVLSFENAGFGYSEDKPLYSVDEVVFQAGKKIGIIGANGVGKSTFLKACAGELNLLSGERKIYEQVDVALFTQNRMDELPLHYTGIAYLSETVQTNAVGVIRSVAGSLGLSENDLDKKIEVLSGGEKSRLSLSKILLSKPGLLLLDEPTNHLDMEACDAMVKGLSTYSGTVITVSHNRDFLDALVDEIMEIKNPQVHWYMGNYSYWHEKQMEAELANQAKQNPNNSHDKVDIKKSKGKKSKEQKRLEAEQRQAKSKEKKKLQSAIEACEKTLEIDKAETAKMDLALSDPTSLEGEGFNDLIKRRGILEKRIKEAEEKWLGLQDALENL